MTSRSLDALNASALACVAQRSAHSEVVAGFQRVLHALGAAVMHGDLATCRAPRRLAASAAKER